jgi:hypothetical protein
MRTTFLTYFRRHHVALLALFLAVGGTSYAAAKLPTNSVATKQIKNGQVKAADLGKSSITSPKVKDGSLKARDFAFGQLPAGPAGPAGPSGADGKPGADGAPATKLFAKSDESGNVLASSGLTTKGQVILQSGVYVMQFDRDLTTCAPVATINDDQAAFITARLQGANSVLVEITQAQSPGIHVAQSFSLAVFC